jgi:hypothetical protein
MRFAGLRIQFVELVPGSTNLGRKSNEKSQSLNVGACGMNQQHLETSVLYHRPFGRDVGM